MMPLVIDVSNVKDTGRSLLFVCSQDQHQSHDIVVTATTTDTTVIQAVIDELRRLL